MELDELKNKWQQSSQPNTLTSKNEIMKLMQQKSHGPVAALKAALGRHVLVLPFAIIILFFQGLTKPGLPIDPLFGLFVAIAVLVAVFFIAAFSIVNKMSRVDTPVVDQLKRQFRALQQLFLCYRVVTFVGVVLLAIFLESFKNMGTTQLMQPWYEVPFWLRIAAYGALLMINFVVSRSFFQREFGNHLDAVRRSLSEVE